jgi:hypothetical protein
MDCYKQFLHMEWGHEHQGEARKRTPELEQGGWANLGACWSVFEHIGEKLKN